MEPRSLRTALKISGYYALATALWILLSDRALLLLTTDPEQLSSWQTVKGLVFILFTTGLVFLLNYREVMRLKTTENRLRQAEARWRSIFDNSGDAVFLHALDGKFIDVNTEACRRLGYTREELCELGPADLDSDDFKTLIPERIQTLEKQGWLVFETAHIARDGTAIPVEVSSRVITYENRSVVLSIARDLTRTRRAEQALTETNAQLRALLEASPLPIFVLDPEGRVQLLWNRAAEQVLGWQAEEVMGQRLPIVPENRLHEFERNLERILAGEHLANVEARRQRKDGTLIDVGINTASVRNTNGEIVGIMSVITDITERKRVEAAEREQRLLAETLTQTAALLSSTLVLEEVLDLILTGISRVVPHDAANIVLRQGDQVEIVRHSGYRERQAEAWIERRRIRPLEEAPRFRQVIETGQILIESTLSVTAESTSDEPPFARNSRVGVPIRYQGTVIGLLNVVSETPGFFTEAHAAKLQAFADQAALAIENARLYAESLKHAVELEQRVEERTAQLNHSKERVEAILNSSTDILLIVTPEGLIDQVNPSFYEILGCSSDEVVLQSLVRLVAEEKAARLEQAFACVTETRQAERLELTVHCRNGWLDADMVLSPIVDQREHLLGVICSLRDISKRKAIEAQLRQMLHREIELGELKTRYLAMAAHDLRNPLAVIQNSVGMIERYNHKLTEEKRQEKFAHIRSSIRVMVDLLDDILTLGRAESGKLEFAPTLFNLAEFCQQLALEQTQASRDRRLIQLTLTNAGDPVYGDPKLLRHILANLLSNAIKYSPEDSPVVFTITGQEEDILFEVKDHGIGIPRQDQDKLFGVFHRASNVEGLPGTGLGLAIVKQSVELHGGQIAWASEEGEGTTFRVSIPRIMLD